MELGTAFGSVLKEHRRRAGLSQEELAFRANMHPSAISFYERGLRQPTLYTVFNLAGILGIHPWEFVREVESLGPSLETKV